MSRLTEEEAAQQFGITTNHEMMANGEIRLRLVSADGSAYVKTIRPGLGAWQNSHVHTGLIETYFVQSGWMALVELIQDRLVVRTVGSGGVISTTPDTPHNVYLSADTVIHTVKYGGAGDWKSVPALDALTRGWSEDTVRMLAGSGVGAEVSGDQRYASYVDTYNHLDNLIWLAPGFVLTAGLSAFGLIVELSNRTPRESSQMLGWLFFSLAIFFFLGGYGVMRLRFHHTIMGAQLGALERGGYFSRRQSSLRSRFLPSAPHLFMLLFYGLAVALFTASIFLFASFAPFLDLFSFGPEVTPQ